METLISEVKRGDWLVWQGIEMRVTRVSRDGVWADLRCKQLGTGFEWRKRQRLPLPTGTERRPS